MKKTVKFFCPTKNGNFMKKELKIIVLLIVLVCLFLSGCASKTDKKNDIVDDTATSQSSLPNNSETFNNINQTGSTDSTISNNTNQNPETTITNDSSVGESSTEPNNTTNENEQTTSNNNVSNNDENVVKKPTGTITLPEDKW